MYNGARSRTDPIAPYGGINLDTIQDVVIATFYQFTPLPDKDVVQKTLQEKCAQLDIKGTILLASEGLNATVSGTRHAIDDLLSCLRTDPRFATMEHKESYDEGIPFDRMKVRLKPEIVTIKNELASKREAVGIYVEPEDWNSLLDDPEVLLIDTRNDYEYVLGTFEGAINPQTDSFTEFPNFVQAHLDHDKHKKIAMFCTGGIRCEKATAYMLANGFDQVYHLHGGILKYLEVIPPAESKWHGDCFVFDNRRTVNHNLEATHLDLCPLCRRILPIGTVCTHCHA